MYDGDGVQFGSSAPTGEPIRQIKWRAKLFGAEGLAIEMYSGTRYFLRAGAHDRWYECNSATFVEWKQERLAAWAQEEGSA
jgi:hypothetical protein